MSQEHHRPICRGKISTPQTLSPPDSLPGYTVSSEDRGRERGRGVMSPDLRLTPTLYPEVELIP